MPDRRLDPHKVAFVVCVNDEVMFEQALGYLRQLDTGGGIPVEIIAIGDAVSMCEGYERGRLQSDAKYKIYMHQDVFILKKDIVPLLVRQFRRSPKTGLIGLAGCKRLPASGVWWDGKPVYNRVAFINYLLDPPQFYSLNTEAPETAVEAVDGLLMATQYDVPWRKDIFTAWDFYDVAQCMEYRRRGYKVALARQTGQPWVVHMSKQTGDSPPGYHEQRQIFLREYAKELAGR